MRKTLLFLIIALICLSACSSNKTKVTTDQKLANADELFARRKYARAAELYSAVYFERASAASAHALLRQADSYYKMNKFVDAHKAYQEFMDAFPNHDQIGVAYFQYALCLFEESLPAQYDQTPTLQSIDAFKVFIQKFPGSPQVPQALEYVRKAQYKLIEKKYQNGYIYYKMKDYSSALMYFDEVTELGNTDHLDRRSLYYSAKLLHSQKLQDKAREKFELLKSKYPGSKETRKLAKYFK